MTIYVPGKSIAFIYILEKGDSKMAGYDWKDRFEEQYYDPQDSRYRDRQAYPETEDERYYERQPYDRRDRRGYYPADRYDIERDYYDRAPRYERRYYDDRYPYYQDPRDYELRDRYEREDRERQYQDRRYYRDEDWRDDRYLRYRRDWERIVTYLQRVSPTGQDGSFSLEIHGAYTVKGERAARISAPEEALMRMV